MAISYNFVEHMIIIIKAILLLQRIQEHELARVNKIAKSLKEFAK